MNPQTVPASVDIIDLNLAVAAEWHAVPLQERDAGDWAQSLAAHLAEGDAAETLALELDDVYTRLRQLDNPNLCAAVYLPRAEFGALDCLLSYEVVERTPDVTPQSFLRDAEDQRNLQTPHTLVRDVFTWAGTVNAGELVGSRTLNSYRAADQGWVEERVVIGVFPPSARQLVLLTFTTYDLNAIADLPAFALEIVETLELELGRAS
ncbi:hypothetical protein [Parafrigoribacterium soli]|uniref:hypothetical protein n=1 Tax=Parafrigoribacterium soli TaxID=3144663 RepID=UPI00387E2BC2